MKSMEDERAESRQHAFHLLQLAFTRSECEVASAALNAHLTRWPEDRVRDLGHGFGYTRLYLEEREAESKRLGLTAEQHEAREALLSSTRIDQSEDLTELPADLEKYEAAQTQVLAWLEQCPDDTHALQISQFIKQDIERTNSFLIWLEELSDEERRAVIAESRPKSDQ